MAPDHSAAIVARPQVLELLRGLHDISAAQESSFAQRWFYFSRLVRFLFFHQTWSSGSDIHMQDKLVALDEDKCHFMYLIARSMGVRNAVEAGTSHGVSTIYLALAVGQNVENLRKVSGDQSISGKVIATEKESSKASKAREHWKTAGSEVEPWIELREGNLLETLKDTDSLPDTIDLLLLDSKAHLSSGYWQTVPLTIGSLDPACSSNSKTGHVQTKKRGHGHH